MALRYTYKWAAVAVRRARRYRVQQWSKTMQKVKQYWLGVGGKNYAAEELDEAISVNWTEIQNNPYAKMATKFIDEARDRKSDNFCFMQKIATELCKILGDPYGVRIVEEVNGEKVCRYHLQVDRNGWHPKWSVLPKNVDGSSIYPPGFRMPLNPAGSV